MATFLQLCQDVNGLVGLQGSIATVVGTSGYQKELIRRVSKCWEDIQNYRKNWLFNQSSKDFSTVVGQTEYTITDIFTPATVSPVRSFVGIIRNDDQTVLLRIPKLNYDLQDLSNEPQIKVLQYAIDDVTQSIWVQPPNEIVSLKVYYYNNLQTLTADADVPICPSEFHNTIVYKAAAETALFFGSSDLYSLMDQKYRFELGALLRSQNPPLSVKVP